MHAFENAGELSSMKLSSQIGKGVSSDTQSVHVVLIAKVTLE